MARDFTLQKYEELCLRLLESGYRPMTLCNYISKRPFDESVCILRHDIDRKLGNALIMAELENRIGISSSYYFRYPYTFNPDIIRYIASLGHEIGYHYETLAKAGGDRVRAIQLFEQELEEFRKIADVRTICMHGSPLSKYDNRDLWKYEDFRRFGIIGEAYLSMVGVGIKYLTDTGRNWGGKHSMRDAMPGAYTDVLVESTDDLIQYLLGSANEKCLYLTAHPERWAGDGWDWTLGYVKDLAFNSGKRVIVAVRI